jgi:hypothetical protein
MNIGQTSGAPVLPTRGSRNQSAGDPINSASWKFTMAFGPDGKLDDNLDILRPYLRDEAVDLDPPFNCTEN